MLGHKGNLFCFEIFHCFEGVSDFYYVSLIDFLDRHEMKKVFLLNAEYLSVHIGYPDGYLVSWSEKELKEITIVYQNDILIDLFGCTCPRCGCKMGFGSCARTLICSGCTAVVHFSVIESKLVFGEGFHPECVEFWCSWCVKKRFSKNHR